MGVQMAKSDILFLQIGYLEFCDFQSISSLGTFWNRIIDGTSEKIKWLSWM